MHIKINNYQSAFFSFWILLIVSCTSPNSQSPKIKTGNNIKQYNNCFVMSPVNAASSTKNLTSDIVSEKENGLKEFAKNLEVGGIKPDTGMLFITSFSRQKMISLSYNCFNTLQNPDSSFIIEIFNNSMPNTGVLFGSVMFVTSYENDIYGFGKAYVFEYELTGAPSQAPHKIYLILHETTDTGGGDYKGYAFCSDGIEWYKSPNLNEDVFSMLIWVKGREKKVEVLMYFRQDKFIPVAHTKIGNWDF